MSDTVGSYLLFSANFILFGKNPWKEIGQFLAAIEKKSQKWCLCFGLFST